MSQPSSSGTQRTNSPLRLQPKVAKQQQTMPKRYLLDLTAAPISNSPLKDRRTLPDRARRRYRAADITLSLMDLEAAGDVLYRLVYTTCTENCPQGASYDRNPLQRPHRPRAARH